MTLFSACAALRPLGRQLPDRVDDIGKRLRFDEILGNGLVRFLIRVTTSSSQNKDGQARSPRRVTDGVEYPACRFTGQRRLHHQNIRPKALKAVDTSPSARHAHTVEIRHPPEVRFNL